MNPPRPRFSSFAHMAALEHENDQGGYLPCALAADEIKLVEESNK
jgi:hypothetical protein